MNHDEETEFVRERLRAALPPMDKQLATDLWPRLLGRMEEPVLRFGWFESILAGLTGLTLAFFPELLPALIFHL